MPRARGIGMPKAKKKKIKQDEEAGPREAEPAPAAAMPPPPPRSPQPTQRPVLPASPGKKARQDAGIALREALKAERRYTKLLRKAENVWLATEKIHERDAGPGGSHAEAEARQPTQGAPAPSQG